MSQQSRNTRDRSDYGLPEQGAHLLRLRGVEDPSLRNARLKWTSSGYDVDSETIVFYGGSGGTPKALALDEEALVVWRPAAKRWEELAAGDSASPLTEFELVEDMAYADTAKNAKPLNSSHDLDSGADLIKLVDLDGKWFGRAAYTSPAGSERGYRFFARFLTDDYASSGLAGWEIVSGEGPAASVIVTVSDYDSDQWDLDVNKSLSGGWASGRLPEVESGSFDLTCVDPNGIAQTAASNVQFLATWVAADEEYRIIQPLTVRTMLVRSKSSGISAASYASDTLTAGTGTVEPLVSNGDGTWDKVASDLTAYNMIVGETIAGEKILQAKTIDGYLFIDVEPCSSGS